MVGMTKEIVTDPLGVDDLKADLKMNVQWLEKTGIEKVSLFFGFSWGNDIYENQWEDIPVSIAAVEPMIADAEQKGYGQLGHDNLYMNVSAFNAKLLYGYETDIHLSFAEENDFVKRIWGRWKANGWLMYSGKASK